MVERTQAAVHFSEGNKIICGVKAGETASGEQLVTCKRCLGLLQDNQAKQRVPIENEDPNAVHFSDGTKTVCGAENVLGIKDEQKITCRKCIDFLDRKAKAEGDPRIKVRVKNQDLNDGVDYPFHYEGTNYRLINNAVHMLPKSVIDHLRSLAYPYKRYVPGAESGHAMQEAGKYYRFTVAEL